jgi:hypothetical protein
VGATVGLIEIHLSDHSFTPFVTLLSKHGLVYVVHEGHSDVPLVRFVAILQSPEAWSALPSVVAEFMYQHNQKILITTKDGQKINAAGLTHKELEWFVSHAKGLKAIETELE